MGASPWGLGGVHADYAGPHLVFEGITCYRRAKLAFPDIWFPISLSNPLCTWLSALSSWCNTWNHPISVFEPHNYELKEALFLYKGPYPQILCYSKIKWFKTLSEFGIGNEPQKMINYFTTKNYDSNVKILGKL